MRARHNPQCSIVFRPGSQARGQRRAGARNAVIAIGRYKPSRDLLGEPNKVLRVNRGDAEDAQPDAGLHEVARKGLAPPMALIQRSYMSNPPARKAAPCAATAGFG